RWPSSSSASERAVACRKRRPPTTCSGPRRASWRGPWSASSRSCARSRPRARTPIANERRIWVRSRLQMRDSEGHAGKPLGRSEREQLKPHRGALVWFTGLSGSGKTTLARAVEWQLHALGVHTYRLDGDVVRDGLNVDLGFSPENRRE